MKKNKWNIIAPKHYIDQLQKSKYFKQDLGQSLTVINTKKGGQREMRSDNFTTWYHSQYKSMLFKSGYIGILHFYIDYYLQKQVMGFFLEGDLEKHQYAIEWDQDKIDKIGIDSWISEKLQEIDETVELSNNPLPKENIKKGESDKLMNNPGSVSWKDIEEYYRSKKNISK